MPHRHLRPAERHHRPQLGASSSPPPVTGRQGSRTQSVASRRDGGSHRGLPPGTAPLPVPTSSTHALLWAPAFPPDLEERRVPYESRDEDQEESDDHEAQQRVVLLPRRAQDRLDRDVAEEDDRGDREYAQGHHVP